jgi:hypothetical protein
VTFYLTAADPDTTPEADDGDFEANLDRWRVWLDGSEADAKSVPYSDGAVTLRIEDFDGRLDRPRTIFVQAIDDGEAESVPVSHTWVVESAPPRGILLVDDCTTGQAAITSDASYRNVLSRNALERLRILDVDNVPLLTESDLDATLALFDHVVWYTDAEVTSSGALGLARASLLDLLEQRPGRMLLVSGLAFGTDGSFGDEEATFLNLFGIDTLFVGPNGDTNFSYRPGDRIQARVHPGLTAFTMRARGENMQCFRASSDAATSSVYFYPDSAYVRTPFINTEQFDVGVCHELPSGGKTAYVGFPLGLRFNSATSTENEVEIQELLKRVGILDP